MKWDPQNQGRVIHITEHMALQCKWEWPCKEATGGHFLPSAAEAMPDGPLVLHHRDSHLHSLVPATYCIVSQMLTQYRKWHVTMLCAHFV